MIYLDYYRDKGEITYISIIDEEGDVHDFSRAELGDIIEFLMLPGHIVTFQKPLLHLKRELEIYPIMEDINLYKKWKDLYVMLWKASERKAPSLKKLARATLDRSISIPRMNRWKNPEQQTYKVLHARLNILKELYEYATLHGILHYYYSNELITVEVETLESA